MEQEIIFAVDIDGVLRNTLKAMVETYNKYFDDNKTCEDVFEFKCDNVFSRIEKETGIKASEWFFQLHSEEVFEESLPYVGALDAFKGLQKYGKVIIVSYQKTTKNKIQALKWLEKNGFPTTDVCFLKDKTLLHTDYLIDDNDWNFKNTNVKHAVLIDAPYNKDIKLSDIIDSTNEDNLITIERHSSLLGFYNDFHLYVKNNGR